MVLQKNVGGFARKVLNPLEC